MRDGEYKRGWAGRGYGRVAAVRGGRRVVVGKVRLLEHRESSTSVLLDDTDLPCTAMVARCHQAASSSDEVREDHSDDSGNHLQELGRLLVSRKIEKRQHETRHDRETPWLEGRLT